MSKFARGRRSADRYPIAKGRFFWAVLLGSGEAVFRVQVKRVEKMSRTNQYVIYTNLTNSMLDNWEGLAKDHAIPLFASQLYRDEQKAKAAVDRHFDEHIEASYKNLDAHVVCINKDRSKVKRRFYTEKRKRTRKQAA